jgi:GTP-binding protein
MLSRRAFSSSVFRGLQHSPEQVEAYKRKRQAEWKRRQGGHSFLDHLIVSVRGGKGGDGCAAFHREKFIAHGPPSGGSGGRGGPVYFLPTPTLTTLSTVPNRILGHDGGHGKGTWQSGKAGEPLAIKVPLGTVVRELGRNDPRRGKDEWENEEDTLFTLTVPERMERMREKRWVQYPGFAEANVQRDDFRESEAAMYKLERERRLARRRRLDEHPIHLDLDKVEESGKMHKAEDAPLGTRQTEYLGHLIAQGGQGGLGNPHFISSSNRTPRYATRGHEGERVTLFLELKLLADVGLVGMPNAGKSTLLKALTGGRAKTEVAGYAFTTLNPVVGIVRVAEDGTFEGELVPDETVYDETKLEEQSFKGKMERGELANSPTRNQLHDLHTPDTSATSTTTHSNSTPTRPGYFFDLYESYRFTIADNPGLIEDSASPFAHAGLGHSFLRAIERSPTLVCVVDFSVGLPISRELSLALGDTTSDSDVEDPKSAVPSIEIARGADPANGAQLGDLPVIEADPCEAVKILKNELETYQEGMSSRIRMVIANKADLVASPSSAPSDEMVEEAQARLKKLEDYVKSELGEDVVVVPISAKYRMNLRKAVVLLKGYVDDARVEKQAVFEGGEDQYSS